VCVVVKFKHLSRSSSSVVIYFINFYLILMIMYCNIYFDGSKYII